MLSQTQPEEEFSQQQEATRELARRAYLRKSLLNFIVAHVPGYQPGWVHKLICRKLEKFAQDIAERRSPRLMLFLPPRSGKSEIASKMFPAWYLGHHPDHEVIACSYALALPLDFSKRIKTVMQAPLYRGVFPLVEIGRDSQAAEAWRTTKGGGYVAAGVQGPITGKGCSLLVIDDPVKDAADSDSDAIQQSTWDWYGSTARTRLAPGGGILLIMTRWSDNDLAGRLLLDEAEARRENPDAVLENWEVLSFEAIASRDEWWDREQRAVVDTPPNDGVLLRKRGEALHPERFSLQELNKLKRTLQPRHWSALYQQNPTPEEGSFFTRDQFRWEASAPANVHQMTVFCAWDLAIGTRESNDWTVGVAGALDWKGDLHILEMLRFRGDAYRIAESICQLHFRWGASVTGMERGQLELAIRPTLEEEIRKRKRPLALAEGAEALVPVNDKVTRARPLQGLLQQGRVYLPQDQEWAQTLLAEMLRFPVGVYDDAVDAMAWLVRLALRVQPPRNPKELVQKARGMDRPWRDRLRANARDWRAA